MTSEELLEYPYTTQHTRETEMCAYPKCGFMVYKVVAQYSQRLHLV